MAPNGARSFFPTSLDLADLLGDTDFDFENCYFLDSFGSQISRIPDSWISRFLDLGTKFLAMAGCGLQGDGAPVTGSRRFVDGTPSPQNSGDPRN